MKKRFLSILITAILCVTLLSFSAFASNDEYGYWYCTTYDELVAALKDPTAREITINGSYMIMADEYGYFSWGDASGILELKPAASSVRIYINGDWTIPESITVKSSHYLFNYGSNTITVNGDWYSLTNGAYVEGGNLIFNGDVYTVPNYLSFSSADSVTFNGAVHIQGNNFIVGDVILGEDATVTGERLTVEGSLTSAPGGSVLEAELALTTNTSVTISGNLEANRITLGTGAVTIAADSDVKANDFYGSTGTLTINGTVEIAKERYHSLGDTSILINEGGTLIMRHGSQLGTTSSKGSMSGDGTLKLYATLHDVYQTFTSHPQLYGLQTNREISTKVTVKNIWKNWEDASDCAHEWDSGVVTPATCAKYGYTSFTCTKCGIQKSVENVEAGFSDNHQWYWSTYGTTISQYCQLCYKSGTATLTAVNGKHTGSPVTDVASVSYNENWSGGDVTFTYENNVEPGENTAKVYMHCNGKTVSATFSIYDGCAHNGGTATCSSPAICTTCGKPYGSKLSHRFYGETTYDSAFHYRACTNEGCTEKRALAHAFYANYTDYELGLAPTGHSCLDCGYGSFDKQSVLSEDGVVSVDLNMVAANDWVVAAVFSADGQFLGCDMKIAEEDGTMHMSISHQGTADDLMIFVLLDGASLNRPAAEYPLQ